MTSQGLTESTVVLGHWLIFFMFSWKANSLKSIILQIKLTQEIKQVQVLMITLRNVYEREIFNHISNWSHLCFETFLWWRIYAVFVNDRVWWIFLYDFFFVCVTGLSCLDEGQLDVWARELEGGHRALHSGQVSHLCKRPFFIVRPFCQVNIVARLLEHVMIVNKYLKKKCWIDRTKPLPEPKLTQYYWHPTQCTFTENAQNLLAEINIWN